MKTSIRLLLFLVFTAFTMLVNAQERKTVTGTVQDSSGRGIPDVSVRVKNTKAGAVTDALGNFRVPANANDVLVISSLGYATKEVPVGTNANIVVSLQGS